MWVRRLFCREGVSGVKIGVSENTVCFRISLQAEPSKPAQAYAVFLAAEVDGEGVLWVGFFFHLVGPPVFGYAAKTKCNFGLQNGVDVV